MKISFNWLKDFINIPLDPIATGDILTDIGLEIEKIQTVESVPGGLKGLVIGEVKSKEKHPDADRLNISTVDVGTAELSQIVCGAANLEVGQRVVVALPGTVLFPTGGESFKIKSSKCFGGNVSACKKYKIVPEAFCAPKFICLARPFSEENN